MLRSAADLIDRAEWQKVWARVFERFFAWVWVAVVALPLTGTWMVLDLGGFGASTLSIHLMQGIGCVMIAIFLHLFFAAYRRFKAAASDVPNAGKNLNQIRIIVGINLALGLVAAAVGASGRQWG